MEHHIACSQPVICMMKLHCGLASCQQKHLFGNILVSRLGRVARKFLCDFEHRQHAALLLLQLTARQAVSSSRLQGLRAY